MKASPGVHQLSGYANPSTSSLNAAFEKRCHAQLLADLPDIRLAAAESERRCPGRHAQSVDARQHGDDFVGQAVAEVFVLLIRTQIRKRQYGNGRRCDARRGLRSVLHQVWAEALPPGIQLGLEGVNTRLATARNAVHWQATGSLPADDGTDLAAQVRSNRLPGLDRVAGYRAQ